MPSEQVSFVDAAELRRRESAQRDYGRLERQFHAGMLTLETAGAAGIQTMIAQWKEMVSLVIQGKRWGIPMSSFDGTFHEDRYDGSKPHADLTVALATQERAMFSGMSLVADEK